MPHTQHIVSHAAWLTAGGWQPALEVSESDIVIFTADDDTGEVVGASWAAADVDPLTRLNPDLPALDHRENA